ncbi:hypothetical protein BJ170DRAFT_462783 [Xylariales sp. AK1849]|nr:hypothetical protein BJ170DRAFT_462783 [Xylariales sp. AK1849]
MAADGRNMPFIKHLASSDRKTRTAALTTLRTFLSASTTARQLTALDNLKLWKGLFYSLYMCDRPIPQQNLCAELANLLEVLPDEAVVPWLTGFWDVLSREWTGIDVLRMEKFLLLVRRVLGASFSWVRDGDGETRMQRRGGMLELLGDWPFETTGDLAKVSVGLRLHVLDIWVDEAEKAGMMGEESTQADGEFLQQIREIVEMQKKSPSKPVRARAQEGLADERLPWNEKTGGSGDEDLEEGAGNQDGWVGFDD